MWSYAHFTPHPPPGCKHLGGGTVGAGGCVCIRLHYPADAPGRGLGGEVCIRPHYPADLVMTAGAQEELSSRG